MRTVRVKVYKFNELNDQAKKKVIERLSDINVDYDWWEGVYSDAEMIGLKITGFDTGGGNSISGKFLWYVDKVVAAIKKEHGEKTSTYKTAASYEMDVAGIKKKAAEAFAEEEFEGDEDNIFEIPTTLEEYIEDNYSEELEEAEEDFLNSLLEDYLIILRKDFEYKQSEEAIIETIEANEYEFTKDGGKFI